MRIKIHNIGGKIVVRKEIAFDYHQTMFGELKDGETIVIDVEVSPCIKAHKETGGVNQNGN